MIGDPAAIEAIVVSSSGPIPMKWRRSAAARPGGLLRRSADEENRWQADPKLANQILSKKLKG